MKRLIVTGSRGWTDIATIEKELNALNAASRGRMVLIHGGAVGADAIANEWALKAGVAVEVYPYASGLGNAGGPTRNRYMLGLGADLVIAFCLQCVKHPGYPPHPTHGAGHCLKEAELLKIPTKTLWQV